MNPPAPASPAHGRRAFGVLGLALIVFVSSIAAAFGVPVLHRARVAAHSQAVAEDLRVAAAAFKAYAHARGDWPPADAPLGKIPTGMGEYLGETNWTEPTPIGGLYAWKLASLHQSQRYAAAITISSAPGNPLRLDREHLLEIDRRLDDGDLALGNFRLGFRHQPLFVLEH